MAQEFLIALGSNLGDGQKDRPLTPKATLNAALSELTQSGARLVAVSRFFATPCFPKGMGPDYVNAAATLSFNGSCDEFLQLLHRVENFFGRARVQRWGSRTLDLDLIACGDLVLPDPDTHQRWRDLPMDQQIEASPDQLILPHPRIQDRAFVLVPLNDIASGWEHPILRQSVTSMLHALPEDQRNDVKPL